MAGLHMFLGGLVSVWVVFGWFGWFLAGLGGFWLVWLDSYFRNNAATPWVVLQHLIVFES